MPPAIPAHDRSASERAERARGAAIAFLLLALGALVVPAVLGALWFF